MMNLSLPHTCNVSNVKVCGIRHSYILPLGSGPLFSGLSPVHWPEPRISPWHTGPVPVSTFPSPRYVTFLIPQAKIINKSNT